jgi:hypothetical protein
MPKSIGVILIVVGVLLGGMPCSRMEAWDSENPALIVTALIGAVAMLAGFYIVWPDKSKN